MSGILPGPGKIVRVCVHVGGVKDLFHARKGGGTETFFTRKLFSGTFISEKCKFWFMQM